MRTRTFGRVTITTMSDVKWIKITTDIFDDEKILMIESLPDADTLIVIWFKLLCLAGKQNNSGVFMLNDKIPYTDKMLATIFRRKEATVQLALQTFEGLGMIQVIDGVITLPNWGKHQNLDALERKTEYMRNYMREYRAKQKLLVGAATYNEAGLNFEDWKAVLTEFNYQCAYCGATEGLEQDHAVSVSDGGTYTVGNIVPACRRCNASKGNSDIFAWYEKQDFFDNERCKHLRKYLRKYLVSQADKDKELDKELERELDAPHNPPTGGKKKKQFVPPTLEEVAAYCQERGNNVDPRTFWDYFNEGGWTDSEGKPVKNWKQKIITWEKHEGGKKNGTQTAGRNAETGREEKRSKYAGFKYD